ncbi:MAG TPA: lysophospholipid acyltransferase family protein [Propionibacteriaceae bacterium]|nr:lysophospholipid acyltransferase family protein [Propionibacteriaceae bacterium]
MTLGLDVPDTSRLGRWKRPALVWARTPIAKAFSVHWDIQVTGRENIPDGPAILAANHAGVFDGPMLVAFTPRCIALAKTELFTGIQGRFVRAAGQIPVYRFGYDIAAIRACLQLLEAEQVLAIFPEGTRGRGDMSHARRGAAYLAMVTGAPVIPVALLGTKAASGDVRDLPPRRARMHIVYGGAIDVPAVPWPRTKQAVGETTEFLRQRCAEHIERAQRDTGLTLI